MATTPLGNISRNDNVCFKDEASGDPPVDKGDINASGAAASRILAINAANDGLEWIVQTGSAANLSALGDCNITTPADGHVIVYDAGTSKWRNFALSGDVTMDDSGAVTIADGAIEAAMLSTADGELGTRILGVIQTAANGAEASNEIEVSYGFVTLGGTAIDFSSGTPPFNTVPAARFVISDSLYAPKRSTTAYISAVTQGVVVEGLNTADCIIVGTEPSTGTHIKFKVKLIGAGTRYVFVGTPDGGYWSVYQYSVQPNTLTFA